MKTLGFIASTALLFALSGSASAEQYKTATDPSGGAMCFDLAGEKAPLTECEPKVTYVKALDPSGASMCFDSNGAKAPLASCTETVAAAPAKSNVGVVVASLIALR